MNIGMDNRALLDALTSPYMDRVPLTNGGTVSIGEYKRHGSVPFDVNAFVLPATEAITRSPKTLDDTRNIGGGSALSIINNPDGTWFGGEDGLA